MTSASIAEKLRKLKERRKNGEIDARVFYISLLQLTTELLNELEHEDISDEDVKKQIPLILTFLEEQISKYAQRGH
ncbi:MAG: hypothetical protein DSY42_05390 [Aquifex sp.]|nr:MAG: hypothetical protein DSY42_05390 [Aquifex sp.]